VVKKEKNHKTKNDKNGDSTEENLHKRRYLSKILKTITNHKITCHKFAKFLPATNSQKQKGGGLENKSGLAQGDCHKFTKAIIRSLLTLY